MVWSSGGPSARRLGGRRFRCSKGLRFKGGQRFGGTEGREAEGWSIRGSWSQIVGGLGGRRSKG